MTFTSAGTEWTIKHEIKEVPFGMLLPKVVLTALCIVQGLIPFAYFQVIIQVFQKAKGSTLTAPFNQLNLNDHIFTAMNGVSISIPGFVNGASSAATPVVILLVVAAAFVIARLFRNSGGSTDREVPTWLCGYTDLNNLNRYRDRSMFSSLKKFLWWTGGNVK